MRNRPKAILATPRFTLPILKKEVFPFITAGTPFLQRCRIGFE